MQSAETDQTVWMSRLFPVFAGPAILTADFVVCLIKCKDLN